MQDTFNCSLSLCNIQAKRVRRIFSCLAIFLSCYCQCFKLNEGFNRMTVFLSIVIILSPYSFAEPRGSKYLVFFDTQYNFFCNQKMRKTCQIFSHTKCIDRPKDNHQTCIYNIYRKRKQVQ